MVQFRTILWAIDPYDESSRHQAPLRVLKYLVEACHSRVQPVYVIPSQDISEGGMSQNDTLLEQKVILELFKGIQLQNVLPPKVVQAASNHPHRVVDALISFGTQMGADAILANTHSWGGLTRIYRGSFVNRLLLRSPIPILALGPEVREVRVFDRILFATHMDPASRPVFRQAVDLAEAFRSDLIAIHFLSRRQRDQEGDDSTAVGESLPRRSHLVRRARGWSNWASRRGVTTEISIQDTAFQAAEQILREADRRKVGIILLESRGGVWASALKGNTVREVIRRARCPVWVQRVLKEEEVPGSSSHLTKLAA